MHSGKLLSACLIVFFCFTVWLVEVMPPETGIVSAAHFVKVSQRVSDFPQKYVLRGTMTDRTTVLQNVPAQTVPFQPAPVGRSIQGFHIGSSIPPVVPSGAISLDAPPPAVWDEQLGLSFTQNFTSLDYNVTAVEQVDVNGYGPAYLLNGLSANGYWYQVGLSWDWPYQTGGYNSGFSLAYEVFNSSGSSIFPSSGGGGLDNFSTAVNQGDTVLLSLHFSSGNVTMYGYDYNTGASAQESYSAEGASDFTGTPYATSNLNGFFTGLMTEWYHVSEYYGNEASVHYSDLSFALSSAWMWIEEFNSNNRTTVFSASNSVAYSNPTQLQYFSSNGATEASDAYDFITGTTNLVPITLSYSVVGGGADYEPPTLTYFLGGVQYVGTLTTSPTTYFMDPSSVWNASNPLSGSSSTETWSSNQQTSGVANSSQTINIAYYHQYLVNLQYNIWGTGAGYSPPRVTIEQFGAMYSVAMPANVFVDAGSQYLYQNPLLGSNSTTEWESPSTSSGTVSSSTSISPTYYLQYNFTASYSISDGSGYYAPSLHGTQFGATYAPTLTTTPTTYWLDSGTSWSVDNVLSGSGNSERWITTATITSGTVSSSSTLNLTYYHQYSLSVYVSLVGSASGYSFPQFDFTCNSSVQLISLSQSPQTAWADNGTSWFISPNPLTGSNSSARWDSQSALSGTIAGAVTIDPTFYLQYHCQFAYQLVNGGSPTAPTLTYTQCSSAQQLTLTTSIQQVWADSGSSWSATNTLAGSNSLERWQAQTASGTLSSSANFSLVYIHQFYLDMESNAATGGSISPRSSWFNASQQIQISAVPNSEWQFETWNGSGTGSYSGALNSTTVVINSPTVEYATFYPGLTINAARYVTVTYSYDLGSGSVSSGSSEVLYVPLNADVSLTANPSFYIFRFRQWSGASNSTAHQIQIKVTAPTVLRANFDFDWLNMAVTILVIAIVLGVLAIMILRRRRTQKSNVADKKAYRTTSLAVASSLRRSTIRSP